MTQTLLSEPGLLVNAEEWLCEHFHQLLPWVGPIHRPVPWLLTVSHGIVEIISDSFLIYFWIPFPLELLGAISHHEEQ